MSGTESSTSEHYANSTTMNTRAMLIFRLGLLNCAAISWAFFPSPSVAGFIGAVAAAHTSGSVDIVDDPQQAFASSSYSSSFSDGFTTRPIRQSAAARAEGKVGDYSWYLGVRADSLYSQRSIASAEWYDEVNVVAPIGIDSVTLRFHYEARGGLSASWFEHGGGSGHAFAQFSVDAGPFSGSGVASNNRISINRHQTFADTIEDTFSGPGLSDDGSFVGQGFFDIDIFLRPLENGQYAGTGYYNVKAQAWAEAWWGTATVDSYHTMELSAITLADGRTPESAGYSLSFASGLLSPNLAAAAAAPEPSSCIVLGGMTGVVLGGRSLRRRFKRAGRHM